MDAVFKALADPTRRSLLDELFREDGQSLGSLDARFSITRFGVMKHLKQLEEAGLVVTKRRGREKLHFLNPVPIRLVHDRWVSKYAEPWAAALSDLKHTLEDKTMVKVFEIYIKTTPERLWKALTDTEMRRKYTFGAVVTSDWTPGSRYEGTGMGTPILEGENLEVDRPRRLVQSFREFSGVRGGGRQERRDLGGDVRDRADRRLLPPDRHPRSAARRRQQSALRRLADGPVRPQGAARDGRATHDARLPALVECLGVRGVRITKEKQ